MANDTLKKQLGNLTQSVRTAGQNAQNALRQGKAEYTGGPTNKAGGALAGDWQQKQSFKMPERSAAQRNAQAWRWNADGSRKTFDQLTTPEVYTWIGTLPLSQRETAKSDFETQYLKNPGSARYDPYYTDKSNNDEGRQLFGVDVFDQEWIDNNRGYLNYVTFTDESYDSPKKPGKNATDQEKAGYAYWQIANTYEATTQAAESEYDKLREEIMGRVDAAKAMDEKTDARSILNEIDWDEYKTIRELRENAKAGNGRYLNRPVQVGEESLVAMVNAAIRGEDITQARDFIQEESDRLSRIDNEVGETSGALIRAGEDGDTADKTQADADEDEDNWFRRFVRKGDEWGDAALNRLYGFVDNPTEEEKRDFNEKVRKNQLAAFGIPYNPDDGKKKEYTPEEIEILKGAVNQDRQANGKAPLIEDFLGILNSDTNGDSTAKSYIQEKLKQKAEKIYGSYETEAQTSPSYRPTTKSMIETYGITTTEKFIRQQISSLKNGELTRGLFSPEEAENDGFINYNTYDLSDEERNQYLVQMDELQHQLFLIEQDKAERENIAQRTREALETRGYAGIGPLKWLWNQGYQDTLEIAEKVPLEDYEEFLRYRLTPGEITAGPEDMKAYDSEKNRAYDKMNATGERAGLLVAGIAEGMDKGVTATTKGAEYLLYTIARYMPDNQGMTREEIYATDRMLHALQSWNVTFDREWIEESKRQELNEEYPVFSMISAGASEAMKMIGQSVINPWNMFGTSIGQGAMNALDQRWLKMLEPLQDGNFVSRFLGNVLGSAGHGLPFMLDSFAQTYETAISEGATEDQAAAAGGLNGVISGALSSAAVDSLGRLGGRIGQVLFKGKAGQAALRQGAAIAAKNGWLNAIAALGRSALGRSALSEGAEEAIEEPIQSLIAKWIYDGDRAWYGEGGVIDPKAIALSGIGGAIAGPMFAVMAGISGALGSGSKAKADDIVAKIMGGDVVTEREIDELLEMEYREAAIQDTAEQLEAAEAPRMEAEQQKVDQAAEKAQAAAETAQTAQAEAEQARQAAKPITDAINNGTASYSDPETIRQLDESSKAVKAAQEKAGQAVQAAADAATEMENAAREAEATRQEIRDRARAEAAAQVDQEMAAEQEAAQQRQAEKAKAEAAREIQPGVVYKNKQNVNLTSSQQMQMQILDTLGRRYGLEFDIVNSIAGGTANASWAGGRRITVALDAVEQAYVQAGMHEAVHYIKKASPDGWTALQETVSRYLSGIEEFDLTQAVQDRINEYAERGQTLTEEQAMEEIIAEAVPQVFTDENATAELVKRDASLIQKIRDRIIKFVNEIREIAASYWQRTGRDESIALLNDTEALMEIARVLDDALEDARGKKLREGEIRYSAKTESDGVIERATGKDRETLISDQRAAEMEEATDGVRRMAARLAREYSTQMQRADMVAGIEGIMGAIQSGEDAEGKADALAREIIGKSSRLDKTHKEEMQATYGEIRNRLRNQGISLTDIQKQEAANEYGDYNTFRKSVFGSVRISADAPSLESQWGEMSSMHPEMFPPDTNEAQMPGVLAEFVRQMKPRYINIYEMDMDQAAADLSLRLQAEAHRMLGGKDAEAAAKQLNQDADAIRERSALQAAKRRENSAKQRMANLSKTAEKIRKARAAGDDNGIREALQEYRKAREGSISAAMKADAADIGIEERRVRADARRLDGMIKMLEDEINSDDTDADREKLVRQMDSFIELRDQLNRQAAALHRQAAITRAEAIQESTGETIQDWMEDQASGIDEQLDEEMKDEIFRLRDEMRERTLKLVNRIRGKAKKAGAKEAYNATTTIGFDDLTSVFADLEPEMTEQYKMAQIWARRKDTAKRQYDMELTANQLLRREIAKATEARDTLTANRLREKLVEGMDIAAALNSQIKQADAQERYCRRLAAEGLERALREGKLPQPIMERVIAMCAEAGRRGRWNENILLKGAEAIRLNATTAARVWDDLFGEYAPIMRAIYYDPVMDGETDRQKWIADWRNRIAALKLTQEESALVQKIGEGRIRQESPEYQKAGAKVIDAVRVFRAFYDEAHAMAKTVLVRNGYDKPGYIGNYFPHIDTAKSFLEKIGFPMDDTSLPTSINGLTDSFSPGRQYSSHLQHRTGLATDYDALFGFEEYISSISNVIFHTDSIQRHRQLESEIRAAAKNNVFGREPNGRESKHLSEFVKWIHEYTNLLAGKKAWADRPFEGTAGRPIYKAATRLKSLKGASAVKGNLASAVTNMVPVATVIGRHPIATLKGAAQLFAESVTGRGNRPESRYMIRKYGSDSVIAAGYTRLSRALNKADKATTWAFEQVDMLATNIVVDACYQANLDKGMDNESAMRSADSEAARLMGDRSKGAMPNIYGSQIFGFITQFQLEVANQSQYFRKDIWRSMSWKKVLGTLFLSSLTGYLWNEINERLTGRRPAADPIDMVLSMYDAWQDTGSGLAVAQSAYNSISEMFPYMGGGRIAAFEGISDILETAFTEGNDWGDIGYSGRQLIIGLVPAGGQLKKSWRGLLALGRGGYYNASGTQLYFPVEATPWTIAQAMIFGPTSTREARAYYSGDTPGLNKSRTEDYETARQRGMSSTEAYRNTANEAAADALEGDVKKIKSATEDNEALERAELQTAPVDAGEAENKSEEAREIRRETIPSSLIGDYWWERRDTDAVRNGIAIWQETGEDWALPYNYTEYKEYKINKRKEYLGQKLLGEVERKYEQGYLRIMSGFDPEKIPETGREAAYERLRDRLDKLYEETNEYAKELISKRNGGR